MAMQAYLTIVGQDGKKLTMGASSPESIGSTYKESYKESYKDEASTDEENPEDRIMIQAFSHQVMSARNTQTGQPTGGRIHKPLVITKIFDKTSPLLLEALHEGDRLQSVKIDWYRNSAGGKREHYYTTELEEAVIVEIKDYMDICQNPEKMDPLHLEEVHFSYRKITVTHVAASTSGVSDWND
ncbi:Hcp family type VI secretion system effector [Pseudomonas sp. PCH199]|uniref:Hcp family type VI secretion system effector n=1 Tax=unclassified Pseudomonas TaxID=196821 RepID=UPI000BD77B8A|nr:MULTISPECIES: Hcp family type VI secretion system effector [unclassified Pseudomonas]MCW8278168.1 Hcp family type VI secretion system effector [Pseudomonas sp. PCH199]PAM81646.1 Hcp1 family type VI secretion system effector [Pseudomonas sp. ERMR1:02]